MPKSFLIRKLLNLDDVDIGNGKIFISFLNSFSVKFDILKES